MKKLTKDTGAKRMWALRLSEQDLQKLEACAKASGDNATKTDLIRHWINEYYAEHVKPSKR